MPFGKCLAQYDTNGWVSTVAFNNDGMRLAFASHDSVLSVAEASSPEKGQKPKEPVRFYGKTLPFKSVEWSGANTIIAAGHDMCVFAFNYNASTSIECIGKHLGKSVSEGTSVSSAKDKFARLDLTNNMKAKVS